MSSMDHVISNTEMEADDQTPYKKWSKNAFGANVPAGGTFTEEESNIVKLAAEEFCSMKQISISSLCSEYDHRSHHRGAWVEIAKKIPTRSVVSIYRHGLRILHPFKRGAWTKEEENILIECAVKYGKKWSTIQKKLNRSSEACRDKYREISNEYVKGEWKDEEWVKLLQFVREYLNVDPAMNFEGIVKHVCERNIVLPWDALSKKMVNRSRLNCLKKWQQQQGRIQKNTSGHNKSDIDSLSSSSVQKEPLQRKRKKMDTTKVKPNTNIMDDNDDCKNATDQKRKRKKSTKRKLDKTSEPMKDLAASLSIESQESIESNQGYELNPMNGNDELWSCDQMLLQRLASSSYTQSGLVPWASIHHPLGDALDRWNSLSDDFYAFFDNSDVVDDLSDKPVWELAKLILEQRITKQRTAKREAIIDSEDEDAKIAARTVEQALGLPSL